MDRAAASAEIQRIFNKYHSLLPADVQDVEALKDGKLYELYVLSHLIEDLSGRGFGLTFRGTDLQFKASPGMIKTTDPHFEVTAPGSHTADFWIFVDIEFDTLGHHRTGASDNSRRHELDIVVTTANAGYPAHSEIALGVECKAVANFGKGLVKEALGVRRELGLLRSSPQRSTLSRAGGVPGVNVQADPASEFWLAVIDAKGLNYKDSPALFSIDIRHIEP